VTDQDFRAVSGIRNAEMKWTNPDRLYTYGVSLMGWPSDIPSQNPSSLTLSQNKRLLSLLQSGTLYFVKTFVDPSAPHDSVGMEGTQEEADALFAWAIQDVDAIASTPVSDSMRCSVQVSLTSICSRLPKGVSSPQGLSNALAQTRPQLVDLRFSYTIFKDTHGCVF